MQREIVTKEQIREMIDRIESKWFKTKEDREELRRLREHLYQKDVLEVQRVRVFS